MQIKLLNHNDLRLPSRLSCLISHADVYDSSCSANAKVLYVDKNRGYFIKIAKTGELSREVELTKYLNGKGYATEIVDYFSDGVSDYMISCKLEGHDGIEPSILNEPKKLCQVFAESLRLLHELDYSDCKTLDHLSNYRNTAFKNYQDNVFDMQFGKPYGINSVEEAIKIVENDGKLLQASAYIHGDYCLPNIIIKDNKLNGFIDLGNGGASDPQIDLYWALFTMEYNLKTDKYNDTFIDIYGRDKIDKDKLRIIAAYEIFG